MGGEEDCRDDPGDQRHQHARRRKNVQERVEQFIHGVSPGSACGE